MAKNLDQQLTYDKKWRRFLQKTWVFRHIPFIEFVFGSGSLAVGNVDEQSDFDVLIGVRQGRIFTARFVAAIFFGLFGWRRSKMDHSVAASDKVCLNHFVTPQSYACSFEKNEYWQKMYQGLAPVYGSEKAIQNFFDSNRGWLKGESRWAGDLRHLHKTPSTFKKILEKMLSGRLGNWAEQQLKAYQVRRIERGLPKEHTGAPRRVISVTGSAPARFTLPPLIVYTDKELEFHPDPVVIEVV